MDIAGKTLAITGAASGIGRALAVEGMRRGANIAAADLDASRLSKTRALAQDAAPSADQFCSVHSLDVANLAQWGSFRTQVLDEHGEIDGIINNAGITFSGSVAGMSYQQLERVMSINFMGMVYGCKEFLPELTTRPQAVIANVSSVFGLFPKKDHAAYCASKYAIRGFTEVFAQELRESTVLVSTVHPGHIATNIVQRAMDDGHVLEPNMSEEDIEAWLKGFKAYGLAPDKAATIILDGIGAGQRRIFVGEDALEGDRLSRADPDGFADAVNDTASVE